MDMKYVVRYYVTHIWAAFIFGLLVGSIVIKDFISKSEDLLFAVSNVIHCSIYFFAFIDVPLPFYTS